MGKNRALQAVIIIAFALMLAQAKCFCGQARDHVRGDTYAASSRDYTVASAAELESISKKIGLSKGGVFIVLSVIFSIILIFPFYFALRELLKPKDLMSLNIDPKYTKDSMYFEKSFEQLIFNAIGEDPPVGMINALFSKYEKVSVNDAVRLVKGSTFRELLFVKTELNTEDNVTLEKEVYVAENAHLGCNNIVRAFSRQRRYIVRRRREDHPVGRR